MRQVYLDNNATTRPDGQVVEAMLPYLTEFYGNPSSTHDLGAKSRQAMKRARDHVWKPPLVRITAPRSRC